MRKLRMTIGTVVLEAELKNTVTADALFKAAPFESSANTWGDEVYFSTPAQVPPARSATRWGGDEVYFSTPAQVGEEPEARTVMQPGELAYWPPGHAIAIGFGPTPASRGNEIRLASPCNVWGTAVGDVKQLKAIRPGAEIKVEGIK